MADSDKELSAYTSIKEDRACAHTHTHCTLKHTRECLQAGVVKSVMNHQDADFASEMKRLEEVEGNKMSFQAVSICARLFYRAHSDEGNCAARRGLRLCHSKITPNATKQS